MTNRQGVLFLVALSIGGLISTPGWGQCRGGGGQRGGQSGPRQGPQFTSQGGGFNQSPQFAQQAFFQQAAMQQAYLQQLQLQRAMAQQQIAMLKAQEREASRQRRLAAATARREKDGQRRIEQRQEAAGQVATKSP